MAETNTSLKVRIGADLREFNRAMGGLRSTLGGLKGAFAGALAGFSLGGAVAAIVSATAEAERVTAQLEARLKSTGGAAGLAKAELLNMASGLQKVTTFGDEAIISTQSMLLTFTKIGRDVFPQALESVLNLATGMGTDLNSAAVQVGKALNDPVKGVTALTKAGVQFTATQKKTIEALVETGRSAEAQRIILGELETQFGGAARAARNTLGGAFTALKEAAGDLLEGDSSGAGLNGVRGAIENLISTLQDPQVKDGVAEIVNGLASIASAAVAATSKIGNFIAQYREALANRGFTPTDESSTAGQVSARRDRLQGMLGRIESGRTIFGEDTAKKLRQELNAISARESAGQPPPSYLSLPSYLGGAPQFSAVPFSAVNYSKPRDGGPVQLGEDADKAKAKVAALRREQERLRKEAERAAEAARKELIAQKERIDAGLRDVETALLRASGDEAGAAYREIEDRYAALIADLKATSNTAGQELVNRLIDVQKAQVNIDQLRTKFDTALGGFGQAEQLANAEAGAGRLDPAEAEARIDSARQQSLATLRQLREQAFAYYQTLSGPEAKVALDAVDRMDLQIAELEATQRSWGSSIAEQATGPLMDFFTALADGTKSAKDAFVDFVKSFANGITRMIAQELALAATRRITRSLTAGLFHGGGIVGAGGALRGGVNPMLFGAAPRYHTGGIAGLAPNEVPAILQRGEEVITRGDPRHARNGGKRARSGGDVTVLVENHGPVPARTEETTTADGGRVIKVLIDRAVGEVDRQIATGTGIGRTLQRAYGLNRQGTVRG